MVEGQDEDELALVNAQQMHVRRQTHLYIEGLGHRGGECLIEGCLALGWRERAQVGVTDRRLERSVVDGHHSSVGYLESTVEGHVSPAHRVHAALEDGRVREALD